MPPLIPGLILFAIGIFTIVGAIQDWDWFMNHRRARLWVKLFGRNGARIFYMLLGVFLIAMGGFFALGILS